MRYIPIVKLPFDIPEKYYKHSFETVSFCGNNILWKTKADNKDSYLISAGKKFNILTPEGVEFVQLEYVKHKL